MIQDYVIIFVSDLSLGVPISSTNKSDCHVIAEILLIVALNTIAITPTPCNAELYA
jgi:hypothetical protein